MKTTSATDTRGASQARIFSERQFILVLGAMIIATPEQQYAVLGLIKRNGFNRIKIGTFHGGHEVNDAQTSIALRWFRSLQ